MQLSAAPQPSNLHLSRELTAAQWRASVADALLHWAAASPGPAPAHGGDVARLARLFAVPGIDPTLPTRTGQRASLVATAHGRDDAAVPCCPA